MKKNGVFFFVMSSPALEIFKSKDTNDDAINGYSVVTNHNSRLYLKIAGIVTKTYTSNVP